MAKLQFMLSMIIFGTIGLFVRSIPLSSSWIAFIRATIGFLFILIYASFKKIPLSYDSIKKNSLSLFFSGLFMGLNWIFLFESYQYTSIACATICYYMAPIFVMVLSPFLLKEKMTLKNYFLIFLSLLGMICISGILETGISLSEESMGIIYALLAAFLYASVILMNKRMHTLQPIDRTLSQLLVSGIVLCPYLLLNPIGTITINMSLVLLLLCVGIIHTGLAYALYFSSIEALDTQSVAIYSYIDPLVAILLSFIFLKESLSSYEMVGAILILGATLMNELKNK